VVIGAQHASRFVAAAIKTASQLLAGSVFNRPEGYDALGCSHVRNHAGLGIATTTGAS